MGFLNKLFGKKEKAENPQESPSATLNKAIGPFERLEQEKREKLGIIESSDFTTESGDFGSISTTKEGRRIFEVTIADGRFSLQQLGQDTVMIIVDNKPTIINGKELHEIMVHWSGSNDTIFLDTYEIPSQSSFSKVLAGIDMDLMESDMDYLKIAVTQLFSYNRINRYLEMGMKSIEELEKESARTGNDSLWPCGRYIGKLIKDENGNYRKKFDVDVGMASHTSPEFEHKRQAAKEFQRAQKQKEIQRHLDEVKRLQADLNGEVPEL